MQGAPLPAYVIDTHALYWQIRGMGRLSTAADTALRLAEAGGAQVIVPAIVVAELYYVARNLRYPLTAGRILQDLERAPGYTFSPLGRRQLELFDQITNVPEMHDRMIVADALVHRATVITRDPIIRGCGLVSTIW